MQLLTQAGNYMTGTLVSLFFNVVWCEQFSVWLCGGYGYTWDGSLTADIGTDVLRLDLPVRWEPWVSLLSETHRCQYLHWLPDWTLPLVNQAIVLTKYWPGQPWQPARYRRRISKNRNFICQQIHNFEYLQSPHSIELIRIIRKGLVDVEIFWEWHSDPWTNAWSENS